MDTPQLDYAGPATPKQIPKSFGWLDAGAAIVLIAFLAYLMVPKFGHGNAKAAAASADLSNLDAALKQYKRDMGHLPNDFEGLDALHVQPDGANLWNGPYIKRSNDPWGNAYIYHATKPVTGKPYTLLSPGPDGTEGTPDDIVHP